MKISVIIACKKITDLCPELMPALAKQSLKAVEILIVTDKLCKKQPGIKRDWAASVAKGDVLAFIDSDAYPHQDWLKNAAHYLRHIKLSAVCGPGLTPVNNSTWQKISGLVWSTKLGAGPYTYRALALKKRFVDDYPTFNLIVKKADFLAIGGFNTHFWPGEDTKLCFDLTDKLNKKILYHPEIIVYHHRRPIFKKHLEQIARYGYQRGMLSKILPQTSKRISYYMPLVFLLTLPLTWPLYLILLIFTAFQQRSWLLMLAIPATHLTYAFHFLKGLFNKNVNK
jgi:cellulose synthase/poly-beta-1,6-N-acetylglucosamine synthase-like glycosyltransferase